jgi:hypothetical protein
MPSRTMEEPESLHCELVYEGQHYLEATDACDGQYSQTSQ